jgi:hypothetical protein
LNGTPDLSKQVKMIYATTDSQLGGGGEKNCRSDNSSTQYDLIHMQEQLDEQKEG